MPTSRPVLKNEQVEWYKKLNPSSVLDIGPGEGTYSNLMRHLNNAHWSCVEVWAPYLNQFDLWSKYNKVYVSDIRCFDFNFLSYKTDLVIFGDCMEHLERKDAKLVVSKLMLNTKNIFLSIPHGPCPQKSVDGNGFEAHLSTWYSDEIIELFKKSGRIVDYKLEDNKFILWWSSD